ncbi:MAG: hypothetical protein GXO48_01330 [Chlorobi bacterium]|nr:hypothetical protein [Chlorobiota bacterium]
MRVKENLLKVFAILSVLLSVGSSWGRGATLELLQGMYPIYGKGISFPVSGFFLFGYPFGTERFNLSVPAFTLVGMRGAPFGNKENPIETFNFFVASLGVEVNAATPIGTRWEIEFSVGGLWNFPFSRVILHTEQLNQILLNNKSQIGTPNDANIISVVTYQAKINSFPSVFMSLKPILWFNKSTFGHVRIGYMHGFNSHLSVSGEYLAFNSSTHQGVRGTFEASLPGVWQWIFVSIGGGVSF